MVRKAIITALVISLISLSSPIQARTQQPSDRPNIVLILADDLGYGDLSSYGATRVHTANIDRLARGGMRFTDAHSPSSVCSPSRYGLMTGRYAWRTWNGTGVIGPDDPLLIEASRLTLPGLLKKAGYRTAIVGKWHLGFGAPGEPGWDDIKGPDYNRDLKPGPLEVGFDYFFGIPRSHGERPRVLIENHRVLGLDPDDPIQVILDERSKRQKHSYLQRFPAADHNATGGEAATYDPRDLAVTLTERAVHWIEQQKNQEPFFLYFAHRNIHRPIEPNARFKGTSLLGSYGDFINELDWSVGEVIAALDRLGFSDRTIVIFASDNGGATNYLPSQVAEINGHRVNGPLFGQKTEVYEGGNRVPLIVRWPGKVTAGSTSDALVALTDVLATAADILDVELPYEAGEDSFSFLGALLQTQQRLPVRQDLVMDSYGGLFAVREGHWKLILGRGGGGTILSWVDHDSFVGQLYDLSEDIGETMNLYGKHPGIVARLSWRLQEIQYSGRSRPMLSTLPRSSRTAPVFPRQPSQTKKRSGEYPTSPQF